MFKCSIKPLFTILKRTTLNAAMLSVSYNPNLSFYTPTLRLNCFHHLRHVTKTNDSTPVSKLLLYRPKAGNRSPLRCCTSEQRVATGRTLRSPFLWITQRFRATRCVSDQLGTLGRKRIHFHSNWRLSAGVELAVM